MKLIILLFISSLAFGGNMKSVKIGDCYKLVQKKHCCGNGFKYVLYRKGEHCKKDCDKSNWEKHTAWYPGKWPYMVIHKLFIQIEH
jgi:hypothetical protein